MNDIPDWAGKRACELLNVDEKRGYSWPADRWTHPYITTVAKLVMQHETPPADPDEEAVKRIIAAWISESVPGVSWSMLADNLARAVSQYKQEKANG